jgi:Uncharacterised protein conserved in bacteria (DUF2336)
VALVKSANSDILKEPGGRPGAGMMARLLLALTALYAQRPTHTAEEQQQYVELALRLIDKVEAPTRVAVAGILRRHPDAPAEIVERLGGIQSSCDGEPEDEPHSTQDQHSADDRYPESNPRFADEEYASTPPPSDAAPAPGQLALITSELGEAFFEASPSERRRLLSPMARGRRDEPQAAAEIGEHIYERIDAVALQGRIDEFIREFERLTDIPKGLCERILNDPSGEPMVVAAKATGIPIAILQRILLLVSPAVSHSVQRVYELTELYQNLDGAAARCLIVQWQAKCGDPIPDTGSTRRNRRPVGLRDSSLTNLRSRFGALTARLQGRAVNARPGPENVVRRGLRSQ